MRSLAAPVALAMALSAPPQTAFGAAPAPRPTGTFLDISSTVLGASMRGDIMAASKVVGGVMDRGAECLSAGRNDCAVAADGVAFDFSGRKYSVSLLAKSGYSGRDVVVAVEDGDGIRIVAPDPYLYAVNLMKIRAMQDYAAMCGLAVPR